MKRTLLVPACAVLFACVPSATEVARTTLTTTAYAAVTADKVFAESYRIASEAAREASSTQEEKDAKMADWDEAADEVEFLVNGLYAALATAEISLDAYEQTKDSSAWDEALACLAEKLRTLERVLRERGIAIPAALAKVLTVSEGLTCAAR
jgi:hypothetical protein